MIPVLYEKNTRDFSGLGLGFLPSWIKDKVHVIEERNGEFYLEGELPVGALNVSQLAVDRIITAMPARGAAPQPFRIQQISKPEGSDTVKILAPHVSYQLTQSILKPVKFTMNANSDVEDSVGTFLWLYGIPSIYSLVGQKFFYFESDIVTSSAVTFDTLSEKKFVTIREALCGMEGSVVDLVGGELEWDAWTVKLHAARGSVTDKVIRYGQNLASMHYDTDARAMVTAYLGYCYTSDERRVDSTLVSTADAGNYAYPRVQAIDLTEHFRELAGEGNDVNPSQNEVQAATAAYAAAHPGNLRTSVTVEAVPEELQGLHLCDSVTVIHPGFNLQQQAKVVKTAFDPVKEVYSELTVGELQADVTSTLAQIAKILSGTAGNLFRKRGM